MEPKIFKFLKNDSTILERSPLENICKLNKLGAFKHYKLWQCMDTIRDKENLENLIKKNYFHRMKNRILVVGGSGFLGHNLLKKNFLIKKF